MDSSEKWYSIKEVSGRYGWSVDTIRRQVRRGYLRAIVLPRSSGKRKRQYESMRIAESELARWERSLQVKGAGH
jgi:hypothetical protein